MAAQYTPAQLLSKELRFGYEHFLPGDQRRAVDELVSFINKVRDGTDELRKALGVPWGDDPVQNRIKTQLVLEAAHWQLAQLFRVGHMYITFVSYLILTSGFIY
jgi:hypothetical protein